MELVDNPAGNYRFLTGGRPYSSGVVAAPGYEIVRAPLAAPLPYREGFALIDRHLDKVGRPPEALCAIELRSPAAFTVEGFTSFNETYREMLEARSLFVGSHNPIARTNVAPAQNAPADPVMVAFSFTAPTTGRGATFLTAGAAELREAEISEEAVIRPGETTADAMAEKAEYVVDMMERRAVGLGCSLEDVTTASVYTVQPLGDLLDTVLLPRIRPAALTGVRWIYARPPIASLEFEMDVRSVTREEQVAPPEA